jgi:ankyrin repeat protein
MLEYLQGENADCCQAQDRIGRKATTHAALNGQVEALTYLIDHCNIDINSVDFYGGNALHWAAAHGRKAVVEMLVRKGIDVNGTVENGRTAASIAENQNKNQCALWLQKWMERLRGLMKAAVGGDLEAIKVRARARGVRKRGRILV